MWRAQWQQTNQSCWQVRPQLPEYLIVVVIVNHARVARPGNEARRRELVLDARDVIMENEHVGRPSAFVSKADTESAAEAGHGVAKAVHLTAVRGTSC
jgi:hypothetical protein